MTEAEQGELNQAAEYLAYWQPQLRLDHIDFELQIMRPEEKEHSILADCRESPPFHTQKIKIRHPNDRTEKDKSIFRRDLEVCVVHELLHTKEIPWRDHPKVEEVLDKDEWLRQLHEDSMDAIAEALVRARRGIKR
jgi:hypothetical protein